MTDAEARELAPPRIWLKVVHHLKMLGETPAFGFVRVYFSAQNLEADEVVLVTRV